jgi:hypothetical protein
MNDQFKASDLSETMSVAELERYLQKSIRPEVMPSTYAIIHMEFRRMAQKCDNARLLLEMLLDFVRISYPHVSFKLQALFDGLFLPSGATESMPKAGDAPKDDLVASASDEVRKRIASLANDRATKQDTPTLTEAELEEIIHNSPTLAPPKPPEARREEMPLATGGLSTMPRPAGAVTRAVPSNIEITASPTDLSHNSFSRSQMPTLSYEDAGQTPQDFMKVADLQEQQAETPANSKDARTEEKEDPDFFTRPTIVNVPSPDLIQKTLTERTETTNPTDKPTTSETERGARQPTEDAFNDAEETWFKKGYEYNFQTPKNGK